MISFAQLSRGKTLQILDDVRNGDCVTLLHLGNDTLGVSRLQPREAGTDPDRMDYQLIKGRDATELEAIQIGCPPLLGAGDLKPRAAVSANEVVCPVQGCEHSVPRQRGHFEAKPEFQCPVHRLYISPSTFQLPSERHNVLDRTPAEIELLSAVKGVKRESRMARERSEDAVTWNAFRFLHTTGLLVPWIESVTGHAEGRLEDLVFWSYSSMEQAQWDLLNVARRAFGEGVRHGSEPDMAILTARTLMFVESKLDATNDTSGDAATLAKRLDNTKLYPKGADGWFAEVFRSDYGAVLTAQRYELMRFWLLGSWMAKQLNREFILCLIMRRQAEPHIPADFQRHTKSDANRSVTRRNWEDLYSFVSRVSPSSHAFLDYFQGKSLGYDADGILRKAFDI